MLEEWIQNGYRILEERENEQEAEKRAVDVWWSSWQRVKDELPDSVSDRKTADREVFDFDFFFQNWVSDLGMALYRTGQEDDAYAQLGVTFNRQALELFSDDEDLFLRNQKQDLSRLQHLNGQPERAIETARAMIEEEPEKAAGYAALSDVYVFADEPDYERAVELLEEALERLSDDEIRSYDLDHRLDDYRASGDES